VEEDVWVRVVALELPASPVRAEALYARRWKSSVFFKIAMRWNGWNYEKRTRRFSPCYTLRLNLGPPWCH